MEFVSFIPGRARVQVDELEDRPLLARHLEKALGQRNGVVEVHVNPTTARLVVRFFPTLPRGDIERLISESLKEARAAEIADRKSGKKKGAPPLKRLLLHSAPHYVLIRKVLFTAVLQRLLDASKFALIGMSLDAVTNPRRSLLGRLGLRGSGPQLVTLGLAGGALWAAKASLDFRERKLSSELTNTVQHELRVALYERIQSLDMSFIDRSRTGDLVSVINGDVNELENLVEQGLKPFMGIGVNALAAAVTFLTVSPKLFLIQALVVPALVWGTVAFVKPARRRFGTVRNNVSEFSSVLLGNIAGIQSIRSFTTEEREAQRVAHYSENLRDANAEAFQFVSTLVPFLETGVGIGFLATLQVGARELMAGRLTPGSFNTLTGQSLRLLESVAYMGLTVARMQRYLAASERIFRLLDQRPTIKTGTRRLPAGEVTGAIRFEDVDFSYGAEPVLRKLSLSIEPGKTTAIVGSTGAGKSTLLKLLLRFYEYQGGRIEVDGVDIRDFWTPDLRRSVALVSQDIFLSHGTVRENIAYGRPEASREEVVQAAKLAMADEFISGLPQGYDTVVGERGATLSGGQRQRIAIARALLTGAPILALDEATSSVDNETEDAIQRSLRVAAAGKTRIVIAHRLSTVRHADRIYVLHDGEVVESGTHDELLARGQLYASFWRIQTGESSVA